ncbi:MAG TPA: DUF2147 domain-containing protein [Stellaceae bacterium]|nr:DUF2147 domain-containing protein [Stellaceae bacterium]
MRLGSILGGLAGLAVATAAWAQTEPPVAGRWLSEARDGVVEIYSCGDKLCGKLVWIKTPLDKDGKPYPDDKNPKPELRSRPRCNLVMLGDFKPTGPDQWGDGWIYDPGSGKTYDAKMRLEGDLLKLRGFVGISLFGETQTWTRADPKQQNC